MIWIIGNKGMLGRELGDHLREAGLSFIGTDREVDILSRAALEEKAAEISPDWIVNCSAYTAVDKAEEEEEAARSLNRDGVAHIAKLAISRKVPLIHISTDYVFDGSSNTPLHEDAPCAPQTAYGRTKLAGEQELRTIWPNHFIIRTAWLYGRYGKNFVDTMLSLMNSRKEITVVNDQTGSPTWTRVLTGLILTIIKQDKACYGTYHLSGEGSCTWYQFAREIYRMGRERTLVSSDCAVTPCSSEQFPTAAKRPAYSLLSKEKIMHAFAYQPPQWQDSLAIYLDSLLEQGAKQ
jgi:dTDP-4-dehydrorhamnose reductase